MTETETHRLRQLQDEAEALIEERLDNNQSEKDLPRFKRWARFWIMVVNAFVRNRCPTRASALAYTTLLSLVPVLAVVVGVSTSFIKSRGEDEIRTTITSFAARFAPQLDLWRDAARRSNSTDVAHEDGRSRVIHEVSSYIANLHSNTLTGTGTIALIFVAISLLSTIESTFNDIWGVIRGRSWVTRIVQYWAAITLGPLALLTAVGLTTSSQLDAPRQFLSSLPIIGGFLLKMMSFGAPVIVLSAAFALAYQLMPNTRVDFRAALVGGLVGGLLWQLNSYFNVVYMARVVSYSKIYGSLGMIPVFLIGLYFSWLILLFGAQVAYAFQNRHTYWQEKMALSISERGRAFAALRLMNAIAARFQSGQGPTRLDDLTSPLGIPSSLASQLLQVLLHNGLLTEVAGAENAYQPAKPLEMMRPADVLQAVRKGTGQDLIGIDDPVRSLVRNEFDRICEAEDQAASRTTLAELALKSAQCRRSE